MWRKPVSVLTRLDILPAAAFEVIEIFKPAFGVKVLLNYFHSVAAGFPSPADDFLDRELDLNDYLISNKSATFYIRVRGDSMKNCGIFNNALLVVDRSVKPVDGDVVLAVIDGEFTCKRIRQEDGKTYLHPENEHYPDLLITEDMNFKVWGVVVSAINDFRRNLKKL